MEKKKYYKKNSNKSNKNNYKNKVNENNVSNKKLTYDELVNVREEASEIKIVKDNIPTYRIIAISIILLAIIFGSLLLFRIF